MLELEDEVVDEQMHIRHAKECAISGSGGHARLPRGLTLDLATADLLDPLPDRADQCRRPGPQVDAPSAASSASKKGKGW